MIIEIDPLEVHLRQEKNPQLVLIDVRRADEFAQIHATNALNIPLQAIESSSNMDWLAADLASDLTKDLDIYFICRSGARSRRAAEIAEKLGYQNIYNVTGGTLSWLEEDLPTQP